MLRSEVTVQLLTFFVRISAIIINSARGHELSERVRAQAYNYMPGRACK